ncbi:CD48 antigen-like isoform X2 [Trachinotus anak]|uniref:CD48 antigen-like isoform X2 n=1 Tax=Trachinotus anak TaxID=443729 RepID=UPI0039F18B75
MFYRMDLIVLPFAISLLFSQATQGSSAVTPVFVQKGNDLLLEIMEADVPEDFSFLLWTFNKKDVLVTFSPGKEPRVSNLYSGRVEASVKNFSVKLKNLQESDSGVYSARVIGDQEQILSEYKVTVQDPVSPVELTVNSVSNSSDSCNLTVTCSTQDSHHININSTFTCDTKTCSQEGGERSKVTSSGASLRVYLVNGSIICNHSNQVSWEKDMKKIVCPLKTAVSNEATKIVTGTTAGLGLVVLLCIMVLLYVKCRRKNRENTVYEVYW